MTVYDRCGDEWITAGNEAILMALPSPSIESAMNITGISNLKMRQRIYDQVKMISRAIVKESRTERERIRAERDAAL